MGERAKHYLNPLRSRFNGEGLALPPTANLGHDDLMEVVREMIQGTPELGLPADAANRKTYCAVLADEEAESMALEVRIAYDYCLGLHQLLGASQGAEVDGGNFSDCVCDFSTVDRDVSKETLSRDSQTFEPPMYVSPPNPGKPRHEDLRRRMTAPVLASSLPDGRWVFVGEIAFGHLTGRVPRRLNADTVQEASKTVAGLLRHWSDHTCPYYADARMSFKHYSTWIANGRQRGW